GVLAPLRDHFSMDWLVGVGIVLFTLASTCLAVLSSFPWVAAAMLAGGVAWVMVMSNFNVCAQTALPHWVRARALSLYLLVFQGTMAVGSWIWGEVASRYSARIALLAASVGLVAGLGAAVRFKLESSAAIDLTPSMHWPEPEFVAKLSPDE